MCGLERWRLAGLLHGDAAARVIAGEAAWLRDHRGRDIEELLSIAESALPTSRLRLPGPFVSDRPLRRVSHRQVGRLTEPFRDVSDLLRTGLASVLPSRSSATVHDLLAAPLRPLGPPLVLDVLWQHRPDLQSAFPAPESYDHDRYLEWARRRARQEAGVSPTWTAAALAPRRRGGLAWRRPAPCASEDVLLVRLADGAKGVGVAGARLAEQMRSAGLVVEEHVVSLDDVRPAPRTRARAAVVAVNADHFQRVLLRLRLPRRTRVAAYWWWEATHVPESVVDSARGAGAVWCGTGFVAEVLSAAGLPALQVPPPVPTRQPGRPTSGEWGFHVLVDADANSGLHRKNPQGGLEAYLAAFQHPAPGTRLTIKVRHANQQVRSTLERLTCDRRDVTLLLDELSAGDQQSLLASASAVLSLHRSEGFGLLLADALALGKLVIATGWSGSQDLAGHPDFWQVQHELVNGPDPDGTYPGNSWWAEPDLGSAATLLRRAREEAQDPSWGRYGPERIAQLAETSARFAWPV